MGSVFVSVKDLLRGLCVIFARFAVKLLTAYFASFAAKSTSFLSTS